MTTKKTLGFGVAIIVLGGIGCIIAMQTLPASNCELTGFWKLVCTQVERDPLVTFASGILVLSMILIVGSSLIIAFMGGVLRGSQVFFVSEQVSVRTDKIIAWIALAACLIIIFVMIGALTMAFPVLFAQ